MAVALNTPQSGGHANLDARWTHDFYFVHERGIRPTHLNFN